MQVNKLKAESCGVECLKANCSCINLDYDSNLAAFSGDSSLQKRVRKKSGKEFPVTLYDLHPTMFSRDGDVSEGSFIPLSLQHHEELLQVTLQHVY